MPPLLLNCRACSAPPAIAVGSAVLLLIALAFVAQALSLGTQAHSVLPELDEWYSLSVYKSIIENGNALQSLFSQHNEHRIFFPRLILFMDYWLFEGKGWFDIGIIFLVQALHASLFLALIANRRFKVVTGAALGSVVLILMFSLRQSENFTWGFQVQFVGVFASASLAATLLAFALAPRWNGGRSIGLSVGAVASATIASFSMTNGMVSGIVLLVLALLARAPKALLIVLSAWLVAVYALFLNGYHLGEGHESLISLMRRPIGLLLYTAAYLGNFLNDEINPAIAFGLCGLLTLAVVLVRAALRRESDPVHLALMGIAAFTAGSAFITALGRSADGIDGSMASRYATGSATFWCAMIVLLWSLSKNWRWGGFVRLGAGAAAAILIVMAAWEQADDARFLHDQRYSYALMEDALLLDLFDQPHFEQMDQPMDQARPLISWLRRNRLSIFATRDAALVGRPLTEAGRVAASPCSGTVTTATADPGLGADGARLAGWAPMKQTYEAPNRVYLVDARQTIVGLASTPFGANAWTGYAKMPVGGIVIAFARDRTGAWCDVGRQTVASPA